MSFYINYKKEFLLTYSETWDEQLSVGLIADFFGESSDWEYIISRETGHLTGDKHDHQHVYLKWIGKNKLGFRTKTQRVWDIKLLNPVYRVVYRDPLTNTPTIKYYNTKKITEQQIRQTFPEIEYFETVEYAHPNIRFKGDKKDENTESTIKMIRYVTKQKNCIRSNFNWELTLADLLETELKNTVKKSVKKNDPDWEYMKQSGMDSKSAKQYLIKNHLNEFMKNWFKWSAAFYLVFGPKTEQFTVNMDGVYWIPVKLWNWIDETLSKYIKNQNNPEWLKNNRALRDKSVIWIGPSKTAKTTFCRSICPNNYYWGLFDGMEDFNENHPLTIIDDFNEDYNKFLPTWKAWFGSQTGFTVNPKYGRRQRINWGHPSIILSNKDFLELNEYGEPTGDNHFSKNDLEYIKENCIIIRTKHKLWEQPPPGLQHQFVRVTISDFWKTEPVNNPEPDSEIENLDHQNEPILIENENILKRTREYNNIVYNKKQKLTQSSFVPNNWSASTSGLYGNTDYYCKKNYFNSILESLETRMREIGENIEQINKDLCQQRRLRRKNNMWYKRTYKPQYINKFWSNWGVKEFETYRFECIENIRTANDNIFYLENLLNQYSDKLEYYILEHSKITNLKKQLEQNCNSFNFNLLNNNNNTL